MGQVWTLKGCHENKQDPCTQAAERIAYCPVCVLTGLLCMFVWARWANVNAVSPPHKVMGFECIL